jgi:DNA-directed RNA polymerase subunit E'/Rpb7
MEHTAVFEEQVPLTPQDFKSQKDASGKLRSIDEILQEKLREKLENRCSRHGFVKTGSIEILSRSMGSLERGRFSGHILYYVQAEGKILNPSDGTELEGEVIRKNKMGIYVNFQDAIRVIVPRDLHINDDAYEKVELGDIVKVEIKKSRFQVNDAYILSVGVFKMKVRAGGKKKVATPELPEDEAEAEAEGEGDALLSALEEAEGEVQGDGDAEGDAFAETD